MPNYLCSLNLVSLFIIFVVSGALILWDDYDDGIIGKLVLIMLAVVAFTGLDKLIPFDEAVRPSASEAWFHFAVAAWLLRHFYRFLCYTYSGKYAWLRKPQKCE